MPSAAAHRHIPPVKSSVDPDDPYSRLKARPGLGTESHLQDETVVSDVVMDKYCSSHWHRGWQTRRIVLTHTGIFFFKEDSPQIVDLLPLHEIESIEFRIPHHDELLKRSKSMLRQPQGFSTSSMNMSGLLMHKAASTREELSSKELNQTLQQEQESHAKKHPPLDADRGGVVITTKAHSHFAGKVYFLRGEDDESAKLWVTSASEFQQIAVRNFKRKFSIRRWQRRIDMVYGHTYFQSVMALLIMTNFVISMIELQLRDSSLDFFFAAADVVFTIVFLLELITNMACNWFWNFWGSAFNVFDFVVVGVTVASLVPGLDLKVISTLRLLRAFRIVRIFGRLSSAKRIITAIFSSIEPVCNVMIIITGIICVFGMFGASAFAECPLFCKTSVAMYTMFTALTLEGWSDLVLQTEEYYPADSPSPVPPKLFFMVYIMVVVYVLLPVFVAAILDGYRTSSYQQSQQELARRGRQALEQDDNIPCFSYDAILHGLLTCGSREQLHERLKLMFDVLDVDENGTVSFEEMKIGFSKILRLNHVSDKELLLEEFEALTSGGRGRTYLNEHGELDCGSFTFAMERQIRSYSKRKLAQYMVAVGEEEPADELIMFALKTLLDISDHDNSPHLFMPDSTTGAATEGEQTGTCGREKQRCETCGCFLTCGACHFTPDVGASILAHTREVLRLLGADKPSISCHLVSGNGEVMNEFDLLGKHAETEDYEANASSSDNAALVKKSPETSFSRRGQDWSNTRRVQTEQMEHTRYARVHQDATGLTQHGVA